ncbi:MAG: cytochrome c-type biogenesis protein CcmH [Vicinamibacteria bacterium]|nr:cytochrome c-type biogenesis protein CcmH [Vicinamibacteria bacterium]
MTSLLTAPLLAFLMASPSTSAPLSLRAVEAIVGQPRHEPLAGEKLDRETQEVAALLRCPVCQGAAVADSPSSMALNMKAQTRDLLALGYDREQILRYFESSYGEFVRLRPPLSGVNWLVWASPIVALIAGAFLVWNVLRRGESRTDDEPQTNDDMASYLQKARDLSSVRRITTAEEGSNRSHAGGRS